MVEDEALVAAHVTRVLDGIERHDPDLVVMDVMLDGGIDGSDVGRMLAATRSTPVVYLTAHCDEETLRRASLTNAAAYILKPFGTQQFHSAVVMAARLAQRSRLPAPAAPVLHPNEQALLAITRVLRGVGLLTGAAAHWGTRPEVSALTPGELDIVRHLVEGRRVPSIATLRGVSPYTVRNQIKAIFRKLRVHSQRELVDWIHTP